jgi:hypothetical protein
MDIHSTEDMYESFRRYQSALLEQFDKLAEEYKFKVVDANPEPRKIFEKLRAGIARVVEGEPANPAQIAEGAVPFTPDTRPVQAETSKEKTEAATAQKPRSEPASAPVPSAEPAAVPARDGD